MIDIQGSSDASQSNNVNNMDYIERENQLPTAEGCKHYKRRCQLKCDSCEEFYPCRICHDEVNYHLESDPKKNHKMDRHKVTEIKCTQCETIQKSQKNCESCGTEFAQYFCSICNLFDDFKYEVKDAYHCDKCGVCRVGTEELSFHCDLCERCVDADRKLDHKCVKIKYDCPVCLDDLQNSIYQTCIIRCGHAMHTKCFESYLKHEINCPLCKKSLYEKTGSIDQ